MKNLEALRDYLKANKHPAHELMSFLLTHSNSPEYLAGALRMAAEAVAADRKAESAFVGGLLANLAAEAKAEVKAD